MKHKNRGSLINRFSGVEGNVFLVIKFKICLKSENDINYYCCFGYKSLVYYKGNGNSFYYEK